MLAGVGVATVATETSPSVRSTPVTATAFTPTPPDPVGATWRFLRQPAIPPPRPTAKAATPRVPKPPAPHWVAGPSGSQAPPSRPPPPPPVPVSSSSAASAVFAAINQSRAAAGLPALRWSGGLSRSAHLHDLAMAAADQLSHQLPGEPSLGTRVSQQGVAWSWVAENVGESPSLSTGGALALEQMMMGDAGHRDNILASSATLVGVDVVFDTVHHMLWMTEDFAN
ncbi:MAG TPA: CAP domain-containing protein [Candidatus Dormibacteraeota bacterium]|nr:CAP domain-containing protein [Candidatus Dormibacteraeota bacterium]